jgi:CheY-like chemotaxis protein
VRRSGSWPGGIAHDFNNLLTVITGNLDFVVSDLPPEVDRRPPVRRDLAEIGASAGARAHAGSPAPAPSAASSRCTRARSTGRPRARAERLLRRVIGEGDRARGARRRRRRIVQADPGQLEQVLMNLAVNARDAMLTPLHGHRGPGARWSSSSTRCPGRAATPTLPPPRSWVRVRVRDTGHGMAPATQAHAFEPFFTTKEVGRGTGLGLATVFGIVSQAGGHLDVASAPGEGTTITILLPSAGAGSAAPAARSTSTPTAARKRARAARGATATRATDGDPHDGDHHDGDARTELPAGRAGVLLVEDEAPVRAAVRRILERAGYAVREARHGADALLLWRAHHASIAALVTDLRMPELGGRELAARLRVERPTLPVVFLSGYAEEGPEVASAPGQAFVEKPFAPEALLDALRQVQAVHAADGAREAAPTR